MKAKVKLFQAIDAAVLEQCINAWIDALPLVAKIHELRYATSVLSGATIEYSVLIIYQM